MYQDSIWCLINVYSFYAFVYQLKFVIETNG